MNFNKALRKEGGKRTYNEVAIWLYELRAFILGLTPVWI